MIKYSQRKKIYLLLFCLLPFIGKTSDSIIAKNVTNTTNIGFALRSIHQLETQIKSQLNEYNISTSALMLCTTNVADDFSSDDYISGTGTWQVIG